MNVWGMLPPHQEIEVWWGCDAFAGWDAYLHDSMLVTAKDIFVATPFIEDTLMYFEDLDSYMESGSGMWSQVGVFQVDGPGPPPNEEPVGWAECEFEGWFLRDDSEADNWLPKPGDEIGLAFKFRRTLPPMRAMIRYNVYSISTWQGECMNSPVGAAKPRPTGTDQFFDFTIVDTAKYDIEIMDFDTYDGFQYNGSEENYMPENPGEIASTRRYIVSVSIPVQNKVFHKV